MVPPALTISDAEFCICEFKYDSQWKERLFSFPYKESQKIYTAYNFRSISKFEEATRANP
jgi:hypothetical protein